MKNDLEIKVTNIGGDYHARLINDGKVIDEMACKEKRDIGYICREMLRWFSKCGGFNAWAESARTRQNSSSFPVGKVWSVKN